MPGRLPSDPFVLAARLRRLIACALVGFLALSPLAAVSTGKTLARAAFPAAPANETEPDAEETEAKLSLRANARWSPSGQDSTHRTRMFPRPTLLSSSPPDRLVNTMSPTDGPRLRC